MRLGLIGTGNMGSRIGPKLLQAGHSLTVYDIRREAAAPLCEAGAEWVDGPAKLAEVSEAVLTSLPDPAIVKEVVLDPERGVLRVMKRGSGYIDISTSTPWLAQEIAEAGRAVGVDTLDAPLSSGGVYIGVGGDRRAYDRWRPVLEAAGDHVFYVGGPGMGQTAKLVRQYVGFSTFMAEAEALVIAAKAGLDVETMAEFLGASVGRTAFRDRVLGGLLARDFGVPGQTTSTLDIVSKDLRLAVELAQRVQAPANIGLATSDTLQRGQAQGWGRHNFWAAVQVLEQMAGTELKPKEKPSQA